MKNIFLVFTAIILFSCNAPSTNATNGSIDATTFEQDLNNNNAQLLDVRTADEYQAGHIKNALLANWMDQTEFTDRVKYLDKDKPVLVYCASGSRSSKAAQWLSSNGFTQVENLTGGFTEWKLENKPVEGASNTPQITIDEYYAALKSDEPVLVDFGAVWCPPCRKMQPVIDALQTEMRNQFKLVKVDGMNTALMQQLDVKALPTFIIYKNGKETWRKQGVGEKEELEKELGK